jgi:prepilin peptidase CpaA
VTEVSYLLLIVVAVLAAIVDLGWRRIPNSLTVIATITGFSLALWSGGLSALSTSLLGFLTGLLLFIPGFLLRMTGGGDVKLMAALGSLLGPSLTLYAFVLYAVTGMVWALVYSLYAWATKGASLPFSRHWGMLRTFLHTGQVAYVAPKSGEAIGHRVPMAPVIAFGAIAAPLLFSP